MSAIDVGVAFSTFALILPAELPDKTFIATLVLATRFRHLPVWFGVAAAFFVQSLIAVTLGGLLSLLPTRLVAAAACLLFVVGAVLLFRGGMESRRDAAAEAETYLEEEQEEVDEVAQRIGVESDETSALKIALTSFLVLFVAEWGDLSQLLTAGLAAKSGEPLSVFIGAWLALVIVGGAAVLAGTWLQRHIPLQRVRFISAGILGILAVIAGAGAIHG